MGHAAAGDEVFIFIEPIDARADGVMALGVFVIDYEHISRRAGFEQTQIRFVCRLIPRFEIVVFPKGLGGAAVGESNQDQSGSKLDDMFGSHIRHGLGMRNLAPNIKKSKPRRWGRAA